MSDSPTPETDAEAMDGIDCYGEPLKSWDYKSSNDGEVVPAEFARRIERERDAARRGRDDAKSIISILVRRRIISWEDVDLVLEQVNEEKEEA